MGHGLAGLKKLYAAGKLRLPGKLVALTDPAAFNAFVLRLDAVDWVVHCKGPPADYGDSVAAMKYLAGYVRGTAICDARIVADDGEYVSFRVKEYRAGGTAAIEKIRGTEFVGRFLMHLLPPRLMRIRYYGMYSGRRRGEDIPRRRNSLVCPSPTTRSKARRAISTATPMKHRGSTGRRVSGARSRCCTSPRSRPRPAGGKRETRRGTFPAVRSPTLRNPPRPP